MVLRWVRRLQMVGGDWEALAHSSCQPVSKIWILLSVEVRISVRMMRSCKLSHSVN
jgi:hypothetical protein